MILDVLEVVWFAGVFFLIWLALLKWTVSLLWPRLGAQRRWFTRPRNICARCEQRSIKQIFFAGRSKPPSPNYYLCTHCGARWRAFFSAPLEDASSAEYDYFFGPDVHYSHRGLQHNGEEPMEVTTFHGNWVKCPNCGWRFSLGKPPQWDKWPMQTHQSCGQRLIVKSPSIFTRS